MRIRERQTNGCTVLELKGRLVSSELPRLVAAFEKVSARGTLAVVVDMRGVTYADAAAVRALAFLHDSLRASGRAMGLCGLRKQPKVLMILLDLYQPHPQPCQHVTTAAAAA
jgi:anti-anti-sigma factor